MHFSCSWSYIVHFLCPCSKKDERLSKTLLLTLKWVHILTFFSPYCSSFALHAIEHVYMSGIHGRRTHTSISSEWRRLNWKRHSFSPLKWTRKDNHIEGQVSAKTNDKIKRIYTNELLSSIITLVIVKCELFTYEHIHSHAHIYTQQVGYWILGIGVDIHCVHSS